MGVPRPWLIALAAVLIVPWLTVAVIWLWPTGRSGFDAGDATPERAARSEPYIAADAAARPPV